jgi:NNMT/PNMT/TEMT family protein
MSASAAIEYSSFEDWDATDYLSEYYSEILEDERHALRFLADSLRGLPVVDRALDAGCGPCVHHCFPLVPYAREIHCADFVAGNREAIARWIEQRPGAHDWRRFAAQSLVCEGGDAGAEAVARRETETRARITRVMPVDVRAADPLGPDARAAYPLVTSHYCAEAISTDKAVFRANMKNLASMVAPGGMLITSACGAADFYKVGTRTFPCSGVTAQEVLSSLVVLGFRDIDLRIRSTPSHAEQGYASVVFARATKPHE